MNDHDRRRYERDLRVQTFGVQNAADFATGSMARVWFAQLDDLITQVEAARVGQSPTHASKHSLIAELNADFVNISRTAQAMALNESGFAAPYLVPDNSSESARLAHADALLLRLEDQLTDSAAIKTAKAALRAKFIAYEMPADFVADLRADLKAIRDANAGNRGADQTGVENTELIGELLDQTAAVDQHLNATMHNKYATKPEKLRAWRTAYHPERDPRHKDATTGTGGTTP